MIKIKENTKKNSKLYKELRKRNKIMIFENSDLSEQINEIESIPEGIIESLEKKRHI